MKAYDKKCAGCRDADDGLCWNPAKWVLKDFSDISPATQREMREEGPCGPEAKLHEPKEGAATMDSVFLSEKWD